MTDLRVSVGERNGDGKRSVVYRFGEREYPDVVDIGSGWQREQSLRRALDALNLPAENLPALGAEVVRLATEKDGREGGEVKSKIDYHLRSCADLVETTFDIRFLVEGIVAANQPLVIAGPQKALKTSIALDMAFSMATAGHFLGRFKAPEPVAVGFFSGESGLPTLAETLRRIARAAGHDPAGIRNFSSSKFL